MEHSTYTVVMCKLSWTGQPPPPPSVLSCINIFIHNARNASSLQQDKNMRKELAWKVEFQDREH